jgi:hypothetical protein
MQIEPLQQYDAFFQIIKLLFERRNEDRRFVHSLLQCASKKEVFFRLFTTTSISRQARGCFHSNRHRFVFGGSLPWNFLSFADFLRCIWWLGCCRRFSHRMSPMSRSFGFTSDLIWIVKSIRFDLSVGLEMSFVAFFADIGGETRCTSIISSVTTNCAWTGLGRWLVKCSFS